MTDNTRYLRSTRGPLAYEVSGEGEWITFCHALGTDRQIWSSQIPALRRNFSVLTYDLRGHGQSAVAGDGNYSFEAMAEDLLDLMDHLHIDRTSLVGISVGGEIAQTLAARDAERVEKLLLSSTACYSDPARADVWNSRIAEALAYGMKPVAAAAVRRWFSEDFRVREPQVVESWQRRIESTSVHAYVGMARTIQAMDLRAAIRGIACKTHVLCGSLDENTGPRVAAQLTTLIPGSKLLVIEGAGHFPNVEAAAAFNTRMVEWATDAI